MSERTLAVPTNSGSDRLRQDDGVGVVALAGAQAEQRLQQAFRHDLVFSLSCRMNRPRSSESTDTSAVDAGPAAIRSRPDKPIIAAALDVTIGTTCSMRQAERQHRTHRLRQAEFRLAGERMGLVIGVLGGVPGGGGT